MGHDWATTRGPTKDCHAPATKSTLQGPQIAAPATKSARFTSRSPANAIRSTSASKDNIKMSTPNQSTPCPVIRRTSQSLSSVHSESFPCRRGRTKLCLSGGKRKHWKTRAGKQEGQRNQTLNTQTNTWNTSAQLKGKSKRFERRNISNSDKSTSTKFKNEKQIRPHRRCWGVLIRMA